VGTTIAGSSFASYASSNQDVDVALRDRAVTTYTVDQCTGGTASASDDTNGVASNGFDDNNSTEWITTLATDTGWLEYDFGSNKTIRQYTITARAGGNYNYTWNDWDLEYYNGSSWVSVDTQSWTWTSNNEKKTYAVSTVATAQRWRINGNNIAGPGAWLGVAEVEMMEAATYNDGDDKLAQSFQVTGTQTVKTVDLWLKKVGAPAGTMTLRIETDTAGSPSGTLVDANATATLAESGLGTGYATATFTFGTSFSISGSTSYWIVLSTDRAVSETNYVLWGADGSAPSYANGEMKSEISSSWSAEAADAVFEVLGEGTAYDEPLAVGSVAGSGEEMGCRFDDGAGASDDTKTTFKNLTGATADIVCEVVL
jgi:F5/8 type C domain